MATIETRTEIDGEIVLLSVYQNIQYPETIEIQDVVDNYNRFIRSAPCFERTEQEKEANEVLMLAEIYEGNT